MPHSKDPQNQESRRSEDERANHRRRKQRKGSRFPGHDFFLLRSSIAILSANRLSSALSTTRWSTSPVSNSSSEPWQNLLSTLRTASAATLLGSRALE